MLRWALGFFVIALLAGSSRFHRDSDCLRRNRKNHFSIFLLFCCWSRSSDISLTEPDS